MSLLDPATGKVIGTCADFSPEDTGNAIAAASAAFPAFKKTLARDRSRMLRRWHDLMMENADDIATLITWENGKPFSEALGEVKYAASYFEWFSEEAPRVTGDIIPASVPGNRIVTLKQPVGVCGILTPWNFPAAMITRKIGPALAAGCTVVAKTPAETPLTANALAVLAHRAGIPKGVVNIISGEKYIPEIGKTLTTHPDVRKISFTGSTAVGKLLVSQSSSTLKKLSLELGGNAPFIVFDDVPDLDAAVAGAIACKFRNSGQTCICANRIYVQKGIYSEFAKRFTAKVKELKLGGGFTQGVTNGPVIHSRSFDKVTSHVRDAIEKGATVELGGRAAPDLGPTFYEPTVLTGVHKGMKIASEETFGPVAGLFQFETEKEVIDLANRAEVGLAGYFFSKDVTRIFRIAENLEVGIVGVNTGGVSDAALP